MALERDIKISGRLFSMVKKLDRLVPVFGAVLLTATACGTPKIIDGETSLCQSIRGDLNRRLVLTGELLALDAIEIQVPRTPSWNVLISWMIEDGAEVEAGQRILEFDNTLFASSLDNDRNEVEKLGRSLELERARAEVTLIDAELRLKRARINVEEARLEADVPERLIGAKKVEDARIALRRAEVELDKATRALELAHRTSEMEIRQREIKLARARHKVEIEEKAINELVVTAPEAGVVTVAQHPWEGRKFQIGDNPWVGLTVLRMPRLDRIAVNARLFDVDDGMVVPGAHVQCRLDMYPEQTFPGIVKDVTPIANETGPTSLRRVFEVMIDLEHPDTSHMRPGMSVRIDVPLPPLRNVILAPREALELTTEGTRVRTADGGSRDVRLGPCSARFCVVEKGLDENIPLAPVRETEE